MKETGRFRREPFYSLGTFQAFDFLLVVIESNFSKNVREAGAATNPAEHGTMADSKMISSPTRTSLVAAEAARTDARAPTIVVKTMMRTWGASARPAKLERGRRVAMTVKTADLCQAKWGGPRAAYLQHTPYLMSGRAMEAVLSECRGCDDCSDAECHQDVQRLVIGCRHGGFPLHGVQHIGDDDCHFLPRGCARNIQVDAALTHEHLPGGVPPLSERHGGLAIPVAHGLQEDGGHATNHNTRDVQLQVRLQQPDPPTRVPTRRLR